MPIAWRRSVSYRVLAEIPVTLRLGAMSTYEVDRTPMETASPHSNGSASRMRGVVQGLLDRAGVRINGDNPWDIRVHDSRFYERVLSGGTIGLGESYMDGWWDCGALDEFVTRALSAGLRSAVKQDTRARLFILLAFLTNRQNRSRAFQVGERHYDLGNDLFEVMLDSRLTYSCGYWHNAKTLDEAQEAKLDLICRKLGVSPDQHVLDIGCGWGSFVQYAAERYGARTTGITVSQEQAELARERIGSLPVEIHLQDYRDTAGTYDHIVSVGMFEHVGSKNYRTFMEIVHRCLKNDGLFLLHTIMSARTGHTIDAWTEKYIFPNSMVPSAQQIGAATEGLFVIEDVHNIGAYYDPTLMSWHRNFTANWDRIADRYGERFFRMWTYYLLTAAGSFRVRRNNVWQVVLSKRGVPGGYHTVR